MVYTCRKCRKDLPISSFRVRKDRTNYRIKSCRLCEREESSELRYLHKIAPKMADKCDCCGGDGPFHLDHCHDTLVFRGWLCKNCNLGIAVLGDTTTGLKMAINYLQKER